MKRLLQRVRPAARQALNDRHRWVQPEALNVAPQWVGAPLARPSRRALALGLDLLVVALLSGVGGLWLVAGLALVVLQLRSRRGAGVADDGPENLAAANTPRAATRAPRLAWAGWAAAALLIVLAASEAQQRWDQWRHPEAAALASAEEQAKEEARDEVKDEVKDGAADQAEALAAAGAASAASAPASAAAAPNPDKLRIALLEAELKEARRHKPLSWREQWSRLWDDLASGLGWGIVYFSLLPAWWGGQTVGKKLFGLRVVELTGKPMTVMRSLKRYGGYAAGMATGGLGFAQVLWDVNRQALQDKAAHTVVIDLRAKPARPPDAEIQVV
jgi:hypothetical protein